MQKKSCEAATSRNVGPESDQMVVSRRAGLARLRRCAQLKASERAQGSPGGSVRGAEGQKAQRTEKGFPFQPHSLSYFILTVFTY